MATSKTASGRTKPGSTAWQQYTANGLYVDVDTSAGKFTGAPVYITSLGGNNGNWKVIGADSIYQPTATGFRVYIKWEDNSALTPATANSYQWHINWIGMET